MELIKLFFRIFGYLLLLTIASLLSVSFLLELMELVTQLFPTYGDEVMKTILIIGAAALFLTIMAAMGTPLS